MANQKITSPTQLLEIVRTSVSNVLSAEWSHFEEFCRRNDRIGSPDRATVSLWLEYQTLKGLKEELEKRG